MISSWSINSTDKKILKDIRDIIPNNIFDVHAHIYRCEDYGQKFAGASGEGPSVVSIDVWRQQMEEIFEGSNMIGGLFFPHIQVNCNMEACNNFIVEQLEIHNMSRGLMLIKPEDDPEIVEGFLDRHSSILGFKPYHVFSSQKPTFEADISSYLPEWAWEIAHRRNLFITLHMVKAGALADPKNADEIVYYCTRYPGAKLILAHAARGFHRYNTIKGLPLIKDLKNVWFDVAAVCEPGAIKAILAEFGHKKLLWGSDFPVSQTRGKCVDVGDGFIWLDESIIKWETLSPACNPILTCIESLRAMREAFYDMKLSDSQIEDIFCNNALKEMITR